MKKGLFCIAIIILMMASLFMVSHGEAAEELYCDIDALTFDENGNPTHDEEGNELIAGVKYKGGYIYLRQDYSAVCVGIETLEHYSFLEDYYPLAKSLYVGEGVTILDGDFLNKMTLLEVLRVNNSVQVIDFIDVSKKSFELDFVGGTKADILVLALPVSTRQLYLGNSGDVYRQVIVEEFDETSSEVYIYENNSPGSGFVNIMGDTYYAFGDGRVNFEPELRIDGAIYRFEDGVLTEGPIYDKIYVKNYIISSGKRGFVEFDGKTYYVSLVSGEFNEKTALRIGGVVRYFNDDYSVREGLYTEADGVTKRYYVKGEYKIGWIDLDDDGVKESYFLSSNGAMVTESRKIGGKMYDYADGVLMLRQGIREEDGDYYFYKDGVRASGFIEVEGKTYYFLSESKKMITAQSYTIRGYKREFNSDHSIKPISGWQVKSGVTYYFENGVCVTGFKEIDGYTYYFKKSDDSYGAMTEGWTSIGGEVYYFFRYGTEKYGRMVTGRQTISSNVYYFNSDGTINSGFVGDGNGNVHYYHYSNMLKGWYTIGGNTYYFTKEQGNMVTGEKSIGGVRYTFTEKGVLLDPAYDGAEVIGGAATGGSGFDISDGDWSDIVII